MALSRSLGVVAAVLMLSAVLSACSTAPKVERVGAETVTDLSGQWNDTDSRLVSEEMINDALSRAWLGEYARNHATRPVVIIGTIRNLSHEHINTQTFANDMARALINSGRVEFVASALERGEVRAERKDQELHAREDTRAPMGEESGADFMLKGSINTIFDTIKGKEAKFYQVDLTLIDMRSNTKVWIGQKKIKKLVSHRGIRP